MSSRLVASCSNHTLGDRSCSVKQKTPVHCTMSPMTPPRCVVWTTPDQAPVLAEVLGGAGIELAGAGCADPARTGQVATALGCEPVDDLRQALCHFDADLVLLGDPGSFGEEASDADLDSLRAAHARNLCVATIEPIPATASGFAGTGFAEALHQGVLGSLATFAPVTRYRPIINELASVLDTYAPLRSCSINIAGPAALGSLGSRLFDTLDLVRWLVGVPSIIEAAYISPSAGRGMHPLPGHTLRNLHGEITMNLRFSDGRCSAVYLSDQLAHTTLNMSIIGLEGHIALDGNGFVWTNPAGEPVDTHKCEASDIDAGRLALQTQLNDLCSGVVPTRPPIDYAAVLSMTHAALLSTRTGQGESPHDVEQLMLSM